MKFQHSEGIQTTPVLRVTMAGSSGGVITPIPGGDATLTIDILQYQFQWNSISGVGEMHVVAIPADPNPLRIFEVVPYGNVLVPGQNERLNIGTHGLVVTDTSVGGIFLFSVWYTIYEG